MSWEYHPARAVTEALNVPSTSPRSHTVNARVKVLPGALNLSTHPAHPKRHAADLGRLVHVDPS
jgi:hypothetical protein